MERLLRTDVFKYIVAPMVSEITEFENIKKKEDEIYDSQIPYSIVECKFQFLKQIKMDIKEYEEEYDDDDVKIFNILDDRYVNGLANREMEECMFEEDIKDFIKFTMSLTIKELKKYRTMFYKLSTRKGRICNRLLEEVLVLKYDLNLKYNWAERRMQLK